MLHFLVNVLLKFFFNILPLQNFKHIYFKPPTRQKYQNDVLCGNMNMGVYHHKMDVFLSVSFLRTSFFLLVNLRTPAKDETKIRSQTCLREEWQSQFLLVFGEIKNCLCFEKA